MRVAPRYGLDDAGDFDHWLSRIEDTRLTVMRVSNIPEHGETQNQAHNPEELSHVVISRSAPRTGLARRALSIGFIASSRAMNLNRLLNIRPERPFT